MIVRTTVTFDGPCQVGVDDRRVIGHKGTRNVFVIGLQQMETNSFSGTVAEAERLLSWLTGLKVTIQTEVAQD